MAKRKQKKNFDRKLHLVTGEVLRGFENFAV